MINASVERVLPQNCPFPPGHIYLGNAEQLFHSNSNHDGEIPLGKNKEG
jgi:hypothetical protein